MKAKVAYNYQAAGMDLKSNETDISVMPNAVIQCQNTCKIIIRENDKLALKIIQGIFQKELYPQQIKSFRVFYVYKDIKEILSILSRKKVKINYDY